ncbi:MAG: ATP-dependent DNA ligase, partial [Armatimonadetes bacterium]|nr:ATP-dependent DNA ligase [Armatimonadota bacterium]
MNEFVAVCEKVAATRSKLAKVAMVAEYLDTLSLETLIVAARFLTGSPLPAWGQSPLGTGYASLRNATCRLAKCSPALFGQALLRHGDLGDACQEVLEGHLPPRSSLSLLEVQAAFQEIAQAQGTGRKDAILEALLGRAAPLQAKYLAKLMTSELRIGLVEGLVEEAIAKMGGAAIEEVRRARMLLGDMGQTALLARQGRLEEARLRLFHPLGFMLASAVASGQEAFKLLPGPALVEDKYDGIRAQVHKQGQRVAVYSRTLDEVSARFPELLPDILALEGEFILDGEIAAYRQGRCLPFALLQRRLGRKKVRPDLLEEVPVVYFAFDLLYLDRQLLLEQPLRRRRALLEGMGLSGRLLPSLALETQTPEAWEEAFQEARSRGNEGLVIKDLASPYAPGRRGQSWLKLKRPSATLDVVVTAVEWGHGKRHHVLSDYTFAVRDGDQLKNIGKAYSGLTDVEIAQMTEWFVAHTLLDQGWRRLVEPAIVLEVAFDAVQPSARHESGYALRFPRILRLRPDKRVADLSSLEEVRMLATRTGN